MLSPTDGGAAGALEAADTSGVTLPRELRDGPAHRIAGGVKTVDAEGIGDRRHIIGTVCETEGRTSSDPTTMPPVVDKDDVVILGEALKCWSGREETRSPDSEIRGGFLRRRLH